jgi:hypothetical protein
VPGGLLEDKGARAAAPAEADEIDDVDSESLG